MGLSAFPEKRQQKNARMNNNSHYHIPLTHKTTVSLSPVDVSDTHAPFVETQEYLFTEFVDPPAYPD